MWSEFGGYPTLFVEVPTSLRSLDKELKNLVRCKVEVQVSSVTVIWLATESNALFHGLNGNSPSLKVVNGIVQPKA